MDSEEWRDLKNYEGIYQISNLGRIKSLNYNRNGYEKIREPYIRTDGYAVVTLCKNRKSRNSKDS